MLTILTRLKNGNIQVPNRQKLNKQNKIINKTTITIISMFKNNHVLILT